MIEVVVFELLSPLTNGRCYPESTPDNPKFPLIVYQVVGGQVYDYLERKIPNAQHYRMQVFCWGRDQLDAAAMMRQVRAQFIEHGHQFLSAETLGQRVGLYDSDAKLYGYRQDFSLWIQES